MDYKNLEEEYWSANQSIAFNFDDLEDGLSGLKEELITSPSIEPNVSQTKGSDLKLSEGLADQQIESLLKSEDKSQTTQSISTKLSPKEAIICLNKGIDINISLFKGKKEKLELLDSALDSNNGNAITITVLHLNRTIKSSIFNQELRKRSLAADHYIFYLRENQRTDQLIDTLSMLGRHEEAAITAYSHAISASNVETKIHNLKNCLRNHFSSGGNDVMFWRDFIAEEITLLEQQLPIEVDDKRQERNAINSLFELIPRTTLSDSPVITTLHYCCLYHYSLPENHFASPKAIHKSYQLSQRQFVWTALSALAKSKQWTQIDALFEYKTLFGSKKLKPFIPFDKVVSVLHKNEAPQEMITKYLLLIDDFDLKFESAKEVKLTKVIIDGLKEGKDRKKLEQLLSKLSPKSEEYFLIQSALELIKWKN